VRVFSTRLEWVLPSSPPVTSVVSHLLHPFRVCFSYVAVLANGASIGFYHGDIRQLSDDCKVLKPVLFAGLIFPTRFECTFASSPPVSSVVPRLFHSFRECF
jgi:hypothetical protein